MDSAREFAAVFVFSMMLAMAFTLVATPAMIVFLWAWHEIFPEPNTNDTGPK